MVSSSQDHIGGSSLRQQQTYPPSSSQYRLQEALSFSSAPSLYTYPASAALASTSHTMEQLLIQGSSPSIHVPPTSHYAASLIPKDSVGGVVHGLPAHYQQHFPAHPYVGTNTSSTRGGAAYAGYQLSPRRVTQYPYI